MRCVCEYRHLGAVGTQRGSLSSMLHCADDSQALRQICRQITSLALGNERVQTKAVREVVLRLTTP